MVIILGEGAKRIIVIDSSSLRVIYDTGIIIEDRKTEKIEAVKEAITTILRASSPNTTITARAAIVIVVREKEKRVDVYCYEQGEEFPTISISLVPNLDVEFDELQDMLKRVLDPHKSLTLLSFALSLLSS